MHQRTKRKKKLKIINFQILPFNEIYLHSYCTIFCCSFWKIVRACGPRKSYSDGVVVLWSVDTPMESLMVIRKFPFELPNWHKKFHSKTMITFTAIVQIIQITMILYIFLKSIINLKWIRSQLSKRATIGLKLAENGVKWTGRLLSRLIDPWWPCWWRCDSSKGCSVAVWEGASRLKKKPYVSSTGVPLIFMIWSVRIHKFSFHNLCWVR